MKYMISLILILSFILAEAPPSEKGDFITILPDTLIENKENVIINDLSVLHPAFRNKVAIFLYECAKQGIELKVVETYRNPERQDYLRKEGFSMLHGGRSKHQHYLAVDVVPIKYGWCIWYDKKLWTKIGKIGEAQGLKWGGRWRRFYDPGHFEYDISIDSIEHIPVPNIVVIPLNY